MLAAYRKTPDIKVWQQYRFNIQVMIDRAFPKEERPTASRTDWKRKFQELELEVAQLKHDLAEARKPVGRQK